MRMIRCLAGALTLVAVLPFAAQAQEKKTLLVAEPLHGTSYLPLYIAIRKGFFANEGLDVKILTVESGAGHTNAVLSGQAFAFIGGPEHDAFAKLRGAEMRSVVNVVDRGNVYMMAAATTPPAPGEPMERYFKGKSIASGFYGGTPNSITRYLLSRYHLDYKTDVSVTEGSSASIIAAVKTGAAQIAVLSEPQITQGIRLGLWGEPIVNIPAMLGPYAYSTLNVREESIEKDPATVEKFAHATILALRYTFDHREEAAAVAKLEFPTMAPDDLKATLDRSYADQIWSKDGDVSAQSWTTAQSVVRDAGLLKQDVPYDQIIDMRFVKSMPPATN